MSNNIEKRIYFLNKLFNFDKKFNVNKKNINNLYLNSVEWCCNYNPDPLIENIGPYEWNKMILELIKIYNLSDYILKKNDYKKETIIIDNVKRDLVENELT